MLRLQIRLARFEDAPFIVGLAHRFAESDIPPWRTRDEIVTGTERQLLRALKRGDERQSTIFIAENGAEPVGFAWALMIEDFYTGDLVGKISEIAVTQNGRGAGRALMRACEDWARERGARLVVLNALEGNARAREFYRRLGYGAEYTMFAKELVT